MRRRGVILILTLVLAGCGRGLPQVTPTVAPSPTPTVGSTDIVNVPTQTPIIRLTNTATLTSQETATPTPTLLPTDLIITETPTPRPFTSTPTPDLTEIALLRPTESPTVTNTSSPTSTPTFTWTPRPTNTPTMTRTWTPTWTPAPPTLTPFFSATPSPTDTPTNTSTPSNTPRPSNTPTNTTTPRPSNTPPPRPTIQPQIIRPTNTPIPSDTPQPTVTVTLTPSFTPRATITPSPLPPTATLSETPTLPPPTSTPVPPTITPSDTVTPPPPTETNTVPPPTFTLTPSPTIPTVTPTSMATFTLIPPTSTLTITPITPTATPTFDATQIALIQLTLIRQGQLTQAALPSWTPVPTNVPTNTIQPQEVTPNIVTATPGGPAFPDNLNGITSTPQIVENFETPATEFPTADVPTPTTLPPEIIQRGFPTPLPAPRYQPYSTANLSTYRFSVQPGTTFAFNGAQITGGFTQYAANPAYPGSFVYIDLMGIIHFSPPGGSETPLNESPFFEGFGADFTDTSQNKNYVRDIGWAPNGQQYFFIVSPPSSNPDKQGAGLWFWQPVDAGAGRTYELLVDCMPGYEATSCQLVQNRPSDYWESLKGQWSANSGRILVTLNLPTEGRQALTIVNAVTDHGYKINAPEFVRYDYGYWTPDGRVVVSGRQPDGRVIVGVTDGNLANLQTLFDASAAGLFMRDAFMAQDGSIVAFGREGDANGPVRLYRIENGGATPISDFIGDGAPGRIDVADDGSQAVVSASGTQYTVYPSGSVIATEIRLDGFGPPGGFEGTNTQYPTGVLPNSRYAPGQQVQMIDTGSRNVRSLPGLNAPVIDVVNPSEFVGILAGPYDADGFTWWYINTARSQQGWFAGQAGDVSYLNP